MPSVVQATPLIAVEAAVIDTETTGLDPRQARVIEIGAVRIRGGRLGDTFQSLVAIEGPVPATATAVHGLTVADLAGAPVFADAYRSLDAFVGGRIVIGHTIGFDLAVLRRECGLAGLPFAAWASLDTRLLAQIVDPSLAGFSLEALASWLGIAVADRHRALGDARLTGEIFLGLVPRLRDAGIRTVAEAMQACRGLTEALERHHRAGWVEPGGELREADRHGIGRRLDAYPYRHRVREAMSAPPAFVAPNASVSEVLTRLMEAQISSVFVGDPASAAAGIVTERDLLRTLSQGGPGAFATPVGDIASRPLVTVPEDAFVYRAIGRMSRRGIRHLAVVAEDGRIVGALSSRDLLRLRASAAIELGDDIDEAGDAAGLGAAWAKVPAMASRLLDEGVSALDIAGIVARELGALARRCARLAEAAMATEGSGAAPCPYAFLVLGSAGRGESLLALDQDHALVFETGPPDGPEDRWFGELGRRVSDLLHEVGVPYCPGKVMASNPAFRGSLQTWRERIGGWIERAQPGDLLNVDILFDFRPVHGEGRLATGLWREAWDAARGARAFLRLLADTTVHESPFGLFGGLRTEDGRIDLKRHALRPLVADARVLALMHGVALRSTRERLDGVRALGVGGASDLAGAVAAHERVLGLILRAQLADIAAGCAPSNRVPAGLVRDTAELKADLRLIATLDDLVRDQLSGTASLPSG